MRYRFIALLFPTLLSACDVAAREGINLGIQLVGDVIIPPIRDSFTEPNKHPVVAPAKDE